MADDRWLVVGLGNPGPEYEGTRHNIGFAAVERIGGSCSWRAKFGGLVAELAHESDKLVLLKPLSFMNRSGGPAQQCAAFYKVPLERFVVIHDDLDIPLGSIRLKRGGGDGGHNGLRSITEHVGSEYLRIRIGVGRPSVPGDATDRKAPAVVSWVLGRFPESERAQVDLVLGGVAECLTTIFADGLAVAQNRFHGRSFSHSA